MNYSTLFTITGLTVSLAGALFLIVPNLSRTRNVDDDRIKSLDLKTGNYTQKKHLKEQKINIIGFVLLGLGFLIQIVGVLYGN